MAALPFPYHGRAEHRHGGFPPFTPQRSQYQGERNPATTRARGCLWHGAPWPPKNTRPPPCLGPSWGLRQCGARKARRFSPRKSLKNGPLRYALTRRPEQSGGTHPLKGVRPEKIQRKRGQKNEIHHQAESETGGAIRPAAEKGVLQVAGATKKTAPKRSTTPAVLTGTVPEWANSTAIAQLLGKTTRRVQQLTQDGILETEVPPGGGARKYRTCETIQRYIAHVEQKAQEIGEGGRLAELNLKKLEAEVALKESQGSLHRLKTAIAEGKYLPAEQATEELAEFMAAFQKFAMTIPARMAGAMSGYADAITIRNAQKAIRKELETMLTAYVDAMQAEDPPEAAP